jgi:hypothetical protein
MGGRIAQLDRLSTAENALIAIALTIAFIGLFMAVQGVLHLPSKAMIGGPKLRSAKELADFVGAIGADSRRGNVIITLAVDSFFPLVYGAALAFSSGYLLTRLHAPAPLRALRLIPLATVAVDYAENICMILLQGFYPRMNAVAGPLHVLTPAKWVLVAASLVVIAIAGVWLLARKARGAG